MESLIAVLTASTTVMLNNVLQNSSSLGNQQRSPLKRPASPLPDLKDGLKLCLSSFCEKKGLSEDCATAAIAALDANGYSPYELDDEKLNIGRIRELTGFNEGQVIGLRKFAGEWIEQQDAKRARI